MLSLDLDSADRIVQLVQLSIKLMLYHDYNIGRKTTHTYTHTASLY